MKHFCLLLLFLIVSLTHANAMVCQKTHRAEFVAGLDATIFTPKNVEPKGNIVIFPPTIGKTPVDNLVARRTCVRGFRVIVMDDWKMSEMDITKLNYIEDLIGKGAHFIDQVDHEYQRPEQLKIGVMGVSLGGFIGLHLKSQDERLGAMLLIAVGQDIDEILSQTLARPFEQIRHDQMEKFATPDQASYAKAMYASFEQLQKTTFDHLDSSEFLMVIPLKDRAVMTENQFKLWNTIGKPSLIQFPMGHVWTIALTEIVYAEAFAKFFFDQSVKAKSSMMLPTP